MWWPAWWYWLFGAMVSPLLLYRAAEARDWKLAVMAVVIAAGSAGLGYFRLYLERHDLL